MSTATTKARVIVSDGTVARFVQVFAYASAIIIFPLSLVATIKFAASPFDVFTGVMLGGVLAAAMVIIGMLVPSAMLFRSR